MQNRQPHTHIEPFPKRRNRKLQKSLLHLVFLMKGIICFWAPCYVILFTCNKEFSFFFPPSFTFKDERRHFLLLKIQRKTGVRREHKAWTQKLTYPYNDCTTKTTTYTHLIRSRKIFGNVNSPASEIHVASAVMYAYTPCWTEYSEISFNLVYIFRKYKNIAAQRKREIKT